jgi:hypothetical protein
MLATYQCLEGEIIYYCFIFDSLSFQFHFIFYLLTVVHAVQ